MTQNQCCVYQSIVHLIICAILCLVTQLCLTVYNSMDCSPPGYSVHGVLQTIILEWVSMPSSWGPSQPRYWTQVSHIADEFFTVWARSETQEYLSGLPIPSPEDLPNPIIEPESPTLQADSLPAELSGKSLVICNILDFIRYHDSFLL